QLARRTVKMRCLPVEAGSFEGRREGLRDVRDGLLGHGRGHVPVRSLANLGMLSVRMNGVDPGRRWVGRYELGDEIAAGGMATVHLGRLVGPVGFSRAVAIKRLHPQFARDPQFVAMFVDEARLAASIRHPNVVSTVDVVTTDGEVFLVMEYVEG